jgi:hypothetical protein
VLDGGALAVGVGLDQAAVELRAAAAVGRPLVDVGLKESKHIRKGKVRNSEYKKKCNQHNGTLIIFFLKAIQLHRRI